MTEKAQQLFEEALGLPPEERARLAEELMASVANEPDSAAGSAWAAEIERRASRALSGASTGTDWPTVRARVERQHLGR